MGKYEDYTYDGGVNRRVFEAETLEEGIAALQHGEEAIKFDWKKVQVGRTGAKKVATEIKNNRTLKLLDLEKNKVGPQGAGSLAEALKVNSSLTILRLAVNQIGPEGAGSLAEALKVNSSLTSLNLELNEIGSEGAASLAEALKVNSSLTYLSLRFAKIDDSGAGSLADALKVNTVLTSLILLGHEIGPEGAGWLAEALKVNSSLTTLYLFGNEIGPEGASSLAEALKVNTSLNTLHLSDLNLESQAYLSACASFQIQTGIDYRDARVRAAQAHGNEARKHGLSPSRVPQEVLDRDSEDDAVNTKTYLEGLLFNPSEAQQLKVLLVGPQQVGKTSLRRALKTKGQSADPTPENHAERATISVDIDEVEFEALDDSGKGGKISLWDFGGQEEYYMTHAFFLSNRSLVMVVVDLQAYEDNEKTFEKCAGKWIRALQMQIFRPKVLIVGTKCDKQSNAQIEAKMASLQQRVDALGRKVRQAITEKAIARSEEKQESQRFASFEGITFTEPKSFVVSGVDVTLGDGVTNLYDFLRELASDTDRGIALRVPKAFEDLRNLIELKLSGIPIPPKLRLPNGFFHKAREIIMFLRGRESCSAHIEDLQQEVEQEDGLVISLLLDFGVLHWDQKGETVQYLINRERNSSHRILNFEDLQREAGLEEEDAMFRLALGLLHDLGIVLWYEKSEQLCDVVFSDPKWVVEIVRQVFRHDLFERREGDKKEGALYDLKSDGTAVIPTLQELLKNKCILDERLLRLFPMWKDMDSEMFNRCVNLLQQFELMYKIPQEDEKRHEPRQFMVPLFLRAGFVGGHGRNVKLGNSSVRESLQKNVSKRWSQLSGTKPLSTLQRYHLFAFFPEGLLFRVIAKTFRIVDFYKLSDREAKAVYKHKDGVLVVVKLTVQLESDGSGILSLNCTCDKDSDDAAEILERTLGLLRCEVDQLLQESFRFVPFEVDFVPCLVRKDITNTPRRNGSLYVSKDASDFSYFKKEETVRRKLETRNKYMVKRYFAKTIDQQLEKVGRKTEHMTHIGKDIRGKLKRNFGLRDLHKGDPLKKHLLEFESKFPDEANLTKANAEEFLRLVQQVVSRLRTEFDCFLAHKWEEGGANHKAVVQLSEGLGTEGLKCWVDSNEMKRNTKEMIRGVDNSHVFVACVTKGYLNAIADEDEYCAKEFDHATEYKARGDLVALFMDEKLADVDTLQELPGFSTLFCKTKEELFDRVLQELFPFDNAALRPALLKMYPATS